MQFILSQKRRCDVRKTVAVWRTILASTCVTLALADDFKAATGKEYKNATVTRDEPDGILMKFSGGIVKSPFTDLSSELREKYHYDLDAEQKYVAEANKQLKATNVRAAADSLRQKAEARVPQIASLRY